MEVSWTPIVICVAIFSHLSYGSVEMIQVIMRHTDINPPSPEDIAEFYPLSPSIKRPAAPGGYGKVNQQGKMKAFQVGQFFRREYGSLLAVNNSSNNILFRTADLLEANDTARLLAQGLSMDGLPWNETMPEIPIDIVTTDKKTDSLFFAYAICRDWLDEKSSIRCEMYKELAKKFPDLEEFYEDISAKTGRKVWSPSSFGILYQLLYAEMMVGYELEDWTKGIFPNGKMEQLAAESYRLQTYTYKLKRMIAGTFLDEFLTNADKVMNFAEKRKAFFYIGSDVHIATLLATLGIFDYKIPGYGSFIVLELHRHRHSHFVEVSYKNGASLGQHPLKPTRKVIPGCSNTHCHLSVFRRLANVMIPEKRDCEKPKAFEWIPS